jgi:Domain of unknown function (DUF222)/HNH endonuclease
METTVVEMTRVRADERWREQRRREDELAALSAHLSAAAARWLDLVWEFFEDVDSDDPAGFLAYRCGITGREAREYLRVAEALQELPATRAAFSRGELTFTKVRALTRVATASSEEGLLELAGALTASQLERALRVFRRVATEDARETHELEFVDWHFDEDGSLYLRARLAAEDGTVLVKALEAARERVVARRREEERVAAANAMDSADAEHAVRPPELPPARVEALLELAEASLGASDEPRVERPRLVVHVDAAALKSDGHGRSELEDGPVIAPETTRRLGCDAELVAQVERDGLPVSVGRTRRTVPPALRRLLEARDDQTCCFPGCERRRDLQAHHRHHWANGGETSFDNLVLLCWHHHRLVHEGGYTIEDDPAGGFRFRNRAGLVTMNLPPRPPPGRVDELIVENHRQGLTIGPDTNRNGGYHEFDLGAAVSAIWSVVTES